MFFTFINAYTASTLIHERSSQALTFCSSHHRYTRRNCYDRKSYNYTPFKLHVDFLCSQQRSSDSEYNDSEGSIVGMLLSLNEQCAMKFLSHID